MHQKTEQLIVNTASYLQSGDDRRERQRKRETLPIGYSNRTA